MNFISIFNMISSIYSELLIHVTTKVTEVTHTGPWNDKYCPVVQINILLTIITAMLSSRANFTELDCMVIISIFKLFYVKKNIYFVKLKSLLLIGEFF